VATQVLQQAVAHSALQEFVVGNLPYTMTTMISAKTTEVEKDALRTHIQDARACDLPLFTRTWKSLYPTISLMRSRAAVNSLRVWSRQKLLHTLASERGLGAERKMLHAASAPGNSWVHHSRNNFLQDIRRIHIACNGDDPAKPPRPIDDECIPSLADTCQSDPFKSLLPGDAYMAFQKFEAAPMLTIADIQRDSLAAIEAWPPGLPIEDGCANGVDATDGCEVRSGVGGNIQMTYVNWLGSGSGFAGALLVFDLIHIGLV
jgi:hypothetical protein